MSLRIGNNIAWNLNFKEKYLPHYDGTIRVTTLEAVTIFSHRVIFWRALGKMSFKKKPRCHCAYICTPKQSTQAPLGNEIFFFVSGETPVVFSLQLVTLIAAFLYRFVWSYSGRIPNLPCMRWYAKNGRDGWDKTYLCATNASNPTSKSLQ